MANLIKQQVAQFRPEIPLLVILRNPGMRERHWEKVSTYVASFHSSHPQLGKDVVTYNLLNLIVSIF